MLPPFYGFIVYYFTRCVNSFYGKFCRVFAPAGAGPAVDRNAMRLSL